MQVQVRGDSELRGLLRNVPTQARSRERLERILDAAGRLLAEDGPAALTMQNVATAATVPVGSIYHLFGDKDTLVDTLALRYWTSFATAVDTVADADAATPLADPIGAVFDALAGGFRAEPGFMALWYSELRTQRVRDATRGIRTDFLTAVDRVLAVHWPDAPADTRAVAAEMVVLTGDGLLREAFRLTPEGDPDVLRECVTMLEAYLADRLAAKETLS